MSDSASAGVSPLIVRATEFSLDTTVLFVAGGEQHVGEINDVRGGLDAGFVGVTVATDDSLFDIETTHHPKNGWEELTAQERNYGDVETTLKKVGAVTELRKENPGEPPAKFRPGDELDYSDGHRYRVVEAPVEREYDQRILAYQLDGSLNSTKKLRASEVVQYYPRETCTPEDANPDAELPR